MTPFQFAKQECSNYAADGSCKGIGINDDGGVFVFGRKAQCVLATRERCAFFEEYVLPMGIEPVNAANVQREKERQEALRLYSKDAPRLARLSGRLCPQCRQREVQPPKRLCYECARQNQKQANRKRVHKPNEPSQPT